MVLNGKQSISLNAFQFLAEQVGGEVKEAGQTPEEALFTVHLPERNPVAIAIDDGGRVRLAVEFV